MAYVLLISAQCTQNKHSRNALPYPDSKPQDSLKYTLLKITFQDPFKNLLQEEKKNYFLCFSFFIIIISFFFFLMALRSVSLAIKWQ